MTLPAFEFPRRFLLQVLPKGFVRIRHYGFLSNRARKEKLGLVRELVTQARYLPEREVAEPPAPAAQPEDRARARHPRPACKKGHLVVVAELSATDLMLHEARSRAPP